MFDRLTMALPTDARPEDKDDGPSILERIMRRSSISTSHEGPEVEMHDGPCYLLELPQEVLERILLLSDYDSIRSAIQVRPQPFPDFSQADAQTCQALRTVAQSPALQYRLILESAGYVDCPNCAHVEASAGEGGAPRLPVVTETSPFTGRTRPSIPSVTLADWPAEPAATAMDTSDLSAVDKARLLREREQRWETLDPAQMRTFQVAGSTGVYELQESILLMCESSGLYQKVSSDQMSMLTPAADSAPDPAAVGDGSGPRVPARADQGAPG